MQNRRFDGKGFSDRGWSRDKAGAKEFAGKLRNQGKLVRVVKGLSSTGDKGYRIYSRGK
jgi:hypothetical protein